jgi:nucleotide-binding universal stress UspA family protein
MQQVVVPVRYPLSEHSRATLGRAIEIATDHDAALTVLHVNRYQENSTVTRHQLRKAVEDAFGPLSNVRYVVRSRLLVEETILDEVADGGADIVVIGKKQAGRWRRMIRRLVDDPDIEQYLDESLDCDVEVVNAVTG